MSHELSVTTFIAAPPEKVWDVLANRQVEWWCPRPWRTEIIAQDRRPGGRCAMMLRGPGGEEEPLDGIYLAFDEGHRIVTTDALDADFRPLGPFMVGIWEIAPEGDGTRYTATARHWTEETYRKHAEMGFTDGWNACAAQLKELCEAD